MIKSQTQFSSLLLQDEPAKFLNKARGPMGLSSSLKGDLELSCEVSPASAPVVWRRDQVEITEDQRTTIISKGTQRKLIIKIAKKSDEGHYSCETATDKVTFQVRIKGKTVWSYSTLDCTSQVPLFFSFFSFLRNSNPRCFLQQGVSPKGGESYYRPKSHPQLQCV